MNTSRQLTIGQRLLQERKNRSWSQQTLANKISTILQNINRWEHDKAIPQPHREKSLGPEHPDVGSTLEHYAILLRKMGRETEAVPLEERAKVIREQQD
jgi:transcriptional regulator with XRE-family HTH domain